MKKKEENLSATYFATLCNIERLRESGVNLSDKFIIQNVSWIVQNSYSIGIMYLYIP